MKRIFNFKSIAYFGENFYIRANCQITFGYEPNKIMEREIISREELKNLTPAKKGELLEVKTKEELENQGFVCTLTKASRWDDKEKKTQILGDNGIDGLTRKKIGQHQYNGIVQCKCYANTSTISADVIAYIDNNVDHWSQERSFGLLVVLTKDSLNQRAKNAILNAKHPIIVATLQDIRDGKVQQQLQNIKWENYPGKYLKRTRIDVESAEEIQKIGEIQISAKKIKGFRYEENIMQSS